jgi:hypothetical protein
MSMAKRPPRLTADDFDGVFDQRFGPLKIVKSPEPHSPEPRSEEHRSGEQRTPEPSSSEQDSGEHHSGEQYSPDFPFADMRRKAVIKTNYTRLDHNVEDVLLPTLSVYEQVVYLRLYRLTWGYGRVVWRVTVETLCTVCGMSDRMCQKALNSLEAKGYIARLTDSRKGAGNAYRVYIPDEIEVLKPLIKTHTTVSYELDSPEHHSPEQDSGERLGEQGSGEQGSGHASNTVIAATNASGEHGSGEQCANIIDHNTTEIERAYENLPPELKGMIDRLKKAAEERANNTS